MVLLMEQLRIEAGGQILDRGYNDGPDWPMTPELLDAERAYRRAFLDAARIAAKWDEPDLEMIEDAWNERRSLRRAAEVEADGMIYYKLGHVVPAADARGKVQAVENVVQGWEELREKRGQNRHLVGGCSPNWVDVLAGF